jgi:hypothetical protein
VQQVIKSLRERAEECSNSHGALFGDLKCAESLKITIDARCPDILNVEVALSEKIKCV